MKYILHQVLTMHKLGKKFVISFDRYEESLFSLDKAIYKEDYHVIYVTEIGTVATCHMTTRLYRRENSEDIEPYFYVVTNDEKIPVY